MNCNRCGTLVSVNDMYCSNCGNKLSDNSSYFCWGVLGFCIPVVGLILFLVWNQSNPKSAKNAGIGALIRLIVDVFIVVMFITWFLLLALLTTSSYS